MNIREIKYYMRDKGNDRKNIPNGGKMNKAPKVPYEMKCIQGENYGSLYTELKSSYGP